MFRGTVAPFAIPAVRRHAGARAATAVLALASALVVAAPARAGCPRELRQPSPLEDRRETYDFLLTVSPEAAAARADSDLARDQHDLLARWARGVLAFRRDSTAADAAVARAAATPGDAGAQIEGGTVFFQRRRVTEGRAAYDRARDAYAALGRTADAAHAVIWRARRSQDAGDRSRYDADLLEADSLARRSADADAIADAVLYRTERALRSDYALAMRLAHEALALLAPLGASTQLNYAHRSLAFALLASGAHDSARVHYGAALEISRARADTLQICRGLAGLGNVDRIEGRYPSGRQRLEEVLALALGTGNYRQIVGAYHDLGTLLDEMGYPLEALDHLNEGLRRMREAKWVTDNEAVMLETMGGMEGALGRYEAARVHLEQALALCRARNIRTTESFTLQALADLNRVLGEPVTARRLVDEGLAAAKASNQQRVQSMLLSQKARVLLELGEPDSALAVARQGKALAAESEPRNVWYLARDEATALGQLGRPREGVAVLESTRTRFAATRDSLQYARTLQLQGSLLLRAGRTAAALAALRQGLAIAQALASPAAVADAQLGLGVALLAAGRAGEAIAVLEPGLTWFEGVQSAVRASEERSAYQERWHDAYGTLARAYARAGRPARAFATLERSRAREARRLSASRPHAARARVPAALAGELDRVEDRIFEVQATLLQQYALPPPRRGADLARLERGADSLKARWAELDRRVQREAPHWARESGLAPVLGAAAARRALAFDERLLAFMVGADATLVFDLSRQALHVHEIALGADSLARHVATVTGAWREHRGEEGARVAAALADALLGPCALERAGERSLIVLPDASLHYLPFEALPLRPGASGRRPYLVERFEVAYATSATLLLGGGPRRPAPAGAGGDVIAFGDPAAGARSEAIASAAERGALPALVPLPHARREAQSLARLYPGARVYLGEEATEARFFAELPRARVLHVAAHAFVDERRPEFSGIVLAPSGAAGVGGTGGGAGGADDGLLQAFEVQDRECDVELAILSACETGAGRLSRGEGLIGLARAFRLAGARDLVVSLWRVDDAATADFMEAFHTRLARGQPVAAALRATRMEFIGGGGAGGLEVTSTAPDSAATRGVASVPRGARRADPTVWSPFILLAAPREGGAGGR